MALGSRAHLSLDTQFSGVHKVEFFFSHVTSDRAQPLDIGKYLATTSLDLDNPILCDYLFNSRRLYVISDLLKARELTIRCYSRKGALLSLEIPKLQALIGATVGVSTEGTTGVCFRGGTDLVFAFRCFEIAINDGSVAMLSTLPGSMSMPFHADKRAPSPTHAVLETDCLDQY